MEQKTLRAICISNQLFRHSRFPGDLPNKFAGIKGTAKDVIIRILHSPVEFFTHPHAEHYRLYRMLLRAEAWHPTWEIKSMAPNVGNLKHATSLRFVGELRELELRGLELRGLWNYGD